MTKMHSIENADRQKERSGQSGKLGNGMQRFHQLNHEWSRNDEGRRTNDEGNLNDEIQITAQPLRVRSLCFVIYLCHFSRYSKRSGAIPWLPSTTFALRLFNRGTARTGHAQKMFCFTRLFLASANAVQEFFFRNRVIGFDVVCPNACPRTDQLADNSICRWTLRDALCKINHGLPERAVRSSKS